MLTAYLRLLHDVANKILLTALALVSMIGFVNADSGNLKQIEVNGIKLEYVSSGSGVPVVFVHGAISDHRVWEGYREQTEREYEFVAYNRRYFGTLPWKDAGEKFTRKQHADDLIKFIESFSDQPVFLVTHSSGGNTGTHATVLRPDLFRAVVHYEPVTLSLGGEIPGFSAAQTQQFAGVESVFEFLSAGSPGDAARRFAEIVMDKQEGDFKDSPAVAQKIWKENGRTIPLSFNAKPLNSTTCEALKRVKTPTLILIGRTSRPFFAMLGEHQASCQSNAVIAYVEDANHEGVFTHSDLVAQLTFSFFDMYRLN